MAYRITDQGFIGSQPIANNSTVQNHPLGTIVKAVDPVYGGGEFIYLKGVANTLVGSWVLYRADDGSTTLIAASDLGPVAIAMSACVASEFGWYQISGKAEAQVGTVAENTILFIESAGIAADTSVTGDLIWGAFTAEATTVQTVAEVEIHRPWVTNGEAG